MLEPLKAIQDEDRKMPAALSLVCDTISLFLIHVFGANS
jgi:hypothetical protein